MVGSAERLSLPARATDTYSPTAQISRRSLASDVVPPGTVHSGFRRHPILHASPERTTTSVSEWHSCLEGVADRIRAIYQTRGASAWYGKCGLARAWG